MRTTITYAAKLALIATLCGLWLFSGAGQVEACSCLPLPSPSEALAESTVVFAGEVVAIRGLTDRRVLSDNPDDTFEFLVELRVSTVWKGPGYDTIFVMTGRDTCEFGFSEGQRYVVYAYRPWKGALPEVSICTRTRNADQASEDLAWLGDGHTPKPGTTAPLPPWMFPTPTPTATPTPEPAAGGCNPLAQSARAPRDAWGLGLIAGVALLALRRRPRR